MDRHPSWTFAPVSRRVLLRRGGQALGLLTGGGLLAACGEETSTGGTTGATTSAGAGTSAATTSAAETAAAAAGFPVPTAAEIAAAKGDVPVLGWPYYESKANLPSGVTSKWAYLTTNEDTLSKTSQAGQFSAVTIYQGQVDQLRKLDRIIPVDTALLENWSEMAPIFQETEVIRRDGQVYAVPYHWGFAFTHYRKDKLAKAPETFADLQAPELRGKVGLPDDPYAVISTFALFAGFPEANNLSREQFDATIKLLNDFKPQVRTVHAYGEEAQLLGRGDVLVDLPSFSGSLVAARDAKLDTAYTLLGAWSYVDCWMVLKEGPNLAGTYAMMNQSLSPQAQLETTKTSLANPVVDSAVSALPEDLRYAATEDVLAKAPLLPGVTVETDGAEVPFQEWLTAWQQFKG